MQVERSGEPNNFSSFLMLVSNGRYFFHLLLFDKTQIINKKNQSLDILDIKNSLCPAKIKLVLSKWMIYLNLLISPEQGIHSQHLEH